jgi:cysteine desulfurase
MGYIYFDNAATTRPCEAVMRVLSTADDYYNSAALYAPAVAVKRKISAARDVVLSRLSKTKSGELVFTSGATESNNMVIFGKITNKRQGIIALAGEHSSVFAPAKYLRDNGYTVDTAPLNRDGTANLEKLGALVRPDTALVMFGMVNSDTGTIQDAAQIIRVVRAANPAVHVHVDATQAFCKIAFNCDAIGADTVAISAHKIHGCKGVGALWMRAGVNLHPIMMGGGQQIVRAGTENTAGALAFAAAVTDFDTVKNFEKVRALHDRLVEILPSGCKVNGINNNPYITNISLPHVLGQTVMNALSTEGVLVGLGSACNGTKTNRTLESMGFTPAQTQQVLRISFCAENTIDEVDTFVQKLKKVLAAVVHV